MKELSLQRQDGCDAQVMRELSSYRPDIRNVISVDVEDYFHAESFSEVVQRSEWGSRISRVEGNTERLLELFSQLKVHATFFVLGWVAEQHPGLVRDIAAGGHELGCHSYWHRLIYKLKPEEFPRFPLPDHADRMSFLMAMGLFDEAADDIMRCFAPESLPVLATLAEEFAICDGWFASLPGPTWPNRVFVHAGTSAGHTDNGFHLYHIPTIFERLEEAGRSWCIYYHDVPQTLVFPHVARHYLNPLSRKMRPFEQRFADDVLEVGQLEAGRFRLNRARFDISEFVATLVKETDRDRLQLVAESDPLWVDADPERLRTALEHILNNALRFSPPGSTVPNNAQHFTTWSAFRR